MNKEEIEKEARRLFPNRDIHRNAFKKGYSIAVNMNYNLIKEGSEEIYYLKAANEGLKDAKDELYKHYEHSAAKRTLLETENERLSIELYECKEAAKELDMLNKRLMEKL